MFSSVLIWDLRKGRDSAGTAILEKKTQDVSCYKSSLPKTICNSAWHHSNFPMDTIKFSHIS